MNRSGQWFKQWKEALIWTGLLLPLVWYGYGMVSRPSGRIKQQPLFEGITYGRYVEQRPRPQLIHLLEIDLGTPGIVPFVTPGIDDSVQLSEQPSEQQYETIAQKTSSFLKTHQLQLAVNANFFYPFEETTPWHYRPREGDPENLVGLAISDGEIVSPGDQNHPALCFLEGHAEIRDDGVCPSEHSAGGCGSAIEPRESSSQRFGNVF